MYSYLLFVIIFSGYVDASLEYLKHLVPKMKPTEECGILAFDEMKVAKKCEWDR